LTAIALAFAAPLFMASENSLNSRFLVQRRPRNAPVVRDLPHRQPDAAHPFDRCDDFSSGFHGGLPAFFF
jgi:hypothetical protein